MTLTDAVSVPTAGEVRAVRSAAEVLGTTSLASRLLYCDRYLRRLGERGQDGDAPLVTLLTFRQLAQSVELLEQRCVHLRRELRAAEHDEAARVRRARRRKGLGA